MSEDLKNVIGIDFDEKLESEYKKLELSLSVLGWELQIQTIINATGLPIGEILAEKETKIKDGSLASNFGYKTLGDFITGKKENLGIGFDWEQWQTNTRAFLYKTLYGVYSSSPEEIVNEYKAIRETLGHIPANAAEYHSAKDQFLVKQREELIAKNEAQLKESLEKEKIANNLYSISSQKLEKTTEELNAAHKRNHEIYTAHQEEMLAKLKEKEEELNIKFDAEKSAIESNFIKEIEGVNFEWSTKLEIENISAKKELNELKDEMNSLRKHYNSENFISVNEVKKLNESLESEKMISKEISLRINEIKKEKSELESLILEQKRKIDSLQKVSNNQLELISTLHGQLTGNYFEGKNVDDSDVKELKRKIISLESYVDKFKEKSFQWKDKYEEGRAEIKEINESLKLAKENLKKLEKVLSSKKRVKKINFGIMFLVGLATASIFNIL